MEACRIELGISPLSSPETDRVLAALRHAWHQPAWVKRQPCGDAWLLAIKHEGKLRPGEPVNWFADRMAAVIWQAIGRYVCVTLEAFPESEDKQQSFVYSEDDYWRILRDFRLSPTAHR